MMQVPNIPGLAESLLFPGSQLFPTSDKAARDLLQGLFPAGKEITIIAGDGVKLNAIYASHSSKSPLLVMYHGNGETIWHNYLMTLYNALHSSGLDILALEYRGYGRSEGKTNIKHLQEDAMWIGNSWISQRYENNHVYVYGYSLGTVPALCMASALNYAKCLLMATPGDPESGLEFYKNNMPPYMRNFFLSSMPKGVRFNTLNDFKELKSEVLMVHGTQDEVCPYPYAQELFKVIPSLHKDFISLPGGRHTDLYWRGGAPLRMRLAKFLSIKPF